ncbi:MAG: VapC toxin family PIN domain ribonuclease [Betaproteobacteria bacterium]|nr:VapC toxin family PIN domain ribonuclease [Betaproteobacteria bacterium]
MQRANCSEPSRADPKRSAPALWRSEFRNLLTGYLRRRATSLSQACELMRQAEAVVADSVAVDSDTVLELVSASRCTAYDCQSSTLALDLELPLVTAERKVLDASPRIAMPLPD